MEVPTLDKEQRNAENRRSSPPQRTARQFVIQYQMVIPEHIYIQITLYGLNMSYICVFAYVHIYAHIHICTKILSNMAINLSNNGDWKGLEGG